MKLIKHTFALLLVMMALCAASYAQDLSGSDSSKKKTKSIEQASLEAASELEYLRGDHKLLEEKSEAQAKTIQTQDDLIASLRQHILVQQSMIADYKEVVAVQKQIVTSAEASIKAYAEELNKVRADRDKRGKGKLRAFAVGAVAVALLRLVFH